MKNRIRSLFIVVFSIFIIFGCSAKKEIAVTEKKIPANRLLRKMEGDRRSIKTFRGTGTLFVKSKKFSGKTSFEILIKKPDSIKISIYGPFGIDIAHGLFTNNNFLFFDVLRNRAFIGSENRDVLRKLFKIDLPFEDLLNAFTGSVNLTNKLSNEPTNYEILEDVYNLTYVDSVQNRKTLYRVSSDNLRIIDFLISTLSGKELLLSEYSKFKDFEGVQIPLELLIRNKKGRESIKVEYKNVTVNEKINSLSIHLPTDVEVIEW